MESFENLCMGCMENMEENGVCPNCGMDNNLPSEQVQYKTALPLKTKLQGRYIIGKSVDINGEGIGYIGYNIISNSAVYIREFMPFNLCKRDLSSTNITPRENFEMQFEQIKMQYLSFNRKLASMRSVSAIFPVFDIFEENNTAYVVCEWLDYITLEEYVQRSGGRLSWNDARALFMPVLSALSELSSFDIHHFGINPKNLVVLRNGKMRLKGFSIEESRRTDSILRPEIFEGFSAPEQYERDEVFSERTDIYGFVSSLLFALTGSTPKSAEKRKIDGKLLIATSVLKTIPPHVVTAIANGMQINSAIRTQKFERLRAELSVSPTIKIDLESVTHSTDTDENIREAEIENIKKEMKNKKNKPTIFLIISIIVLICVLCSFAAYLIFTPKETDQKSDVVSSSSIASSETNNEIDIPNLVGQNFDQVKSAGQNQGFYQIKLSSEDFSDNITKGSIISQTPNYSADKKIAKGSVIAVVVSKGPKTRALPSVAGKSLAAASKQLSDCGFVPKKSQEQYSDKYDEGVVIGYEDYDEGDKLDYGTEVNLIVSKGSQSASS